jgi:cytoskeleton protein RodZ
MSESLDSAGAGGYAAPVRLRQARDAAGLHIGALAAALKVPVKKLEALEAGRYEELPDLTFARALASSICRHLKIDPQPVLEQIPLGHRPELGQDSQGINAPFKAADDGASFHPIAWLTRPAVLIALLLMVGALAMLFVPGPASPPLDGPETAGSSPATPDTAAEPVAPQPAPVAAAPDPVQLPLPAVTEANNAAAPPETVGALLSITATADSWVEVLDGKGASQVQRMLKSGDVLSFSANPPYSVVLGRADAVRVSVRGQPFDVMPFARNSVARFQVK